MSAIVAVLVSGLVAGALAAGLIMATHGRADPLDPRTEIRWLVRSLEHRPRAMAWVRRRLDRTTATGFMTTAAFVILVGTAVVVGLLFEMFSRNALIARWDTSVANWGARHVDAADRDVLVWITDLGGSPVVLGALVLVAGIELVRRRWASVAFLTLVVGGQFLINNLLKIIVERERPDIARLVGTSGYSFPSGHTVAATATWAAIALVASTGASRGGRAIAAGLAAAIAAAVGATRALLGAHWLTDVLAGLVLGWGWFTLVAVLFGGRRQRAALPLERAAHVTLPATPHDAAVAPVGSAAPRQHDPQRTRRLRAGALEMLKALVVFVSVGAAIGLTISYVLDQTGFVRGDHAVNEWFVRQRTSTWNDVTHVMSMMGNTESVIAIALVAVVAMRVRWSRWNEPLVLVLGLCLEVITFLILGNIVGRDRPDVERLDAAPPTSSFPSGHAAAATVLFVGLAWILRAHLSNAAVRAAVGLAGAATAASVATSRVYRGMHHPTDVVAGVILGIACLVVAIRVARPVLPPAGARRDAASGELDTARHPSAGGAEHVEAELTPRPRTPQRSHRHRAGAAGAR